MRSIALMITLIAIPLAAAQANIVVESYVGMSADSGSWAPACLADVNVGAVCVPLEGWERAARVGVRDEIGIPGSEWIALGPDLAPLASGDACLEAQSTIPPGSAYFVVHMPPKFLLRIIQVCDTPATVGSVAIAFE